MEIINAYSPRGFSSRVRTRRTLRHFVPALLLTLLLPPAAHAATAAFDDFSTRDYSDGTGWTGNWTETSTNNGDTGPGCNVSSLICIPNSPRALHFEGTPGADPFIYRQVDLSDPSIVYATVTLDIVSSASHTSIDELRFMISDDGGANWQLLRNFHGTLSQAGVEIDISSWRSANTRIRFGISGDTLGSNDYFEIDNVSINTFDAPPPPPPGVVAYDRFISGGYDDGEGWLDDWTETDDAGGPGGGDIAVAFGALLLQGDDDTQPSYVTRTVDLSSVNRALMMIDIGVLDATYEASDEIEIYTRADTTDAWTQVRQFNMTASVVDDLPRFNHVIEIPPDDISASTQVRIGLPAEAGVLTEAGEGVLVDNIRIYGAPTELDFETDEFVGGTPLGNGNNGPSQVFDANNQPYADDGITITLSNEVNGPLMLFDTLSPTGEDGDLGSPNPLPNAGETCGAGDPTVFGEFGVIGGPGENCQPLGNVLIISEDGDVNDPNDDPAGGIVSYAFDFPVDFTAIMFLDDILADDTHDPSITLHLQGGGTLTASFADFFDFAGNGPNGKHWASFHDFGAEGPIAGVTGIDIDYADTSGATEALFISSPAVDFGDAPDTYGTDLADGGEGVGAHHRVDFLNALRMGNDIDSEADGQPSANANGDDAVEGFGADDEDGISLPNSSTEDGDGDDTVYTATVTVTNDTGADALLCAWMDFDQDGVFENASNTSTTASDPDYLAAADDGERSCVTVPASNTGDFDIAWTIPESERDNTGSVTFRFRLTTDDTFLAAPSAHGLASDGEVEDIVATISSLPVSLNEFSSRLSGSLLHAQWGTVSETFNIGFALWAKVAGDWQRLTGDPVLSRAADSVTPQTYRTRVWLRDVDPRDIEQLALSSIETTGSQEFYGPFLVGQRYGEQALPDPIPWQRIESDHAPRLQTLGYRKTGRGWRRAVSSGDGHRAVEFEVAEPGMQQVTYEQLASAGLDLAGVAASDIVVTREGEGIPRHVDTRSPKAPFGPGAVVRFWGVMPDYPDALYVEHYVYRVEYQPGAGLDADEVTRRANDGSTWSLHPVSVNEDAGYSFVNALADPWYAARLVHPWGPVAYEVELQADHLLLDDRAGRVEVTVAGLTSIAEIEEDHRVVVRVNDATVSDTRFDGQDGRVITGDVPPGVIRAGANRVEVSLPGGTGAPFDLVLVDRVTLWYPRQSSATENRLVVADPPQGEGIRVEGLDSDEIVSYASDAAGNLARLPVIVQREKQGDGYAASVPTLAGNPRIEGVRYWISTASALHVPELLGISSRPDLLSGRADFLVIAHPAFLPLSGDEEHPLNDYVSHRRSQGWTPRVISIADIQDAHGGGMPLPGALTRFLAAADKAFDYDHVLLVGGDSYDYQDNLGFGSMSFIPTRYGRAGAINHSPSDALLADLDGDGIGDKAIGRWPVRTLADLSVMVTKTLDFEDTQDGTMYQRTSAWVADGQDPNVPSFVAQAERMIDRLQSPVAGGQSIPWPQERVERIYFDELTPEPGTSTAEHARATLFGALEEGRTLTGFFGHGAPGAWTFKGLLNASHVADLHNEGQPTLVTTLTCYTSYFVSPHADTLANRLMNGYRLDDAGARIPGVANGAIAVHGAATLSSYRDNESVAGEVLSQQLDDGDTLGVAIRSALRKAAGDGNADVSRNWILLGDPTLTIANRP